MLYKFGGLLFLYFLLGNVVLFLSGGFCLLFLGLLNIFGLSKLDFDKLDINLCGLNWVFGLVCVFLLIWFILGVGWCFLNVVIGLELLFFDESEFFLELLICGYFLFCL